MGVSPSERERIEYLRDLRAVLLDHHFDLDHSLHGSFQAFRRWLQNYPKIPDDRLLGKKLLETRLVQQRHTVTLIVSELSAKRKGDHVR